MRQRVERANAAHEDQERARHAAVERAMAHREWEEEFRQFKEKLRFDLSLTADAIVGILEQMRDEHKPSFVPYSELDDEFVIAVKLLPYAKMFAEECAIECIKEKKT